MDIFDWYFKQIVTQGQMDWAFDRVQDAMHGISNDNALIGIVDGLAVTEHSTPPDKTVDVAGPGTAYDKTGQRCYVPDTLTVVDCSKDEYGTDSNPPTPTYERYISVFIRFDRNLTEPALDGNNITVWTKQLESFEIFVRLGAEASAGTAVPPPLMTDAELLVDILVTSGFTAITNGDLDFTRREDWVRFTGSVLGDRVYGTSKAAVSDMLNVIETLAGGGLPFTFTDTWFGGQAVQGSSPPVATIHDALNAIVYDLAKNQPFSGAPGAAGDELIGMKDSAPYAYVTNWTNANLNTALHNVAQSLNNHIGGSAPYHPATAVTFSPYSFLSSTNVQAVIQELVDDLASQVGGSAGTYRIGGDAISDSPSSISSTTLRAQLAALLGHINDRGRIASTETITGAWNFDALIDFNGGARFSGRVELENDGYFRGDSTQTSAFKTIFERNGGRARLMYQVTTSGTICWTYNCYWDTGDSKWKYTSSTESCYILRLTSSGLYLQRMDSDDPEHTFAGWDDTDWTSGFSFGYPAGSDSMAIYPKGITNPGSTLYDRVRAGLSVMNSGADSEAIWDLTAVTYHGQMESAVAGDVTVSSDYTQNWAATPTIVTADEFGCFITSQSDSIISDGVANWRGTLEIETSV